MGNSCPDLYADVRKYSRYSLPVRVAPGMRNAIGDAPATETTNSRIERCGKGSYCGDYGDYVSWQRSQTNNIARSKNRHIPFDGSFGERTEGRA
jgi:hypothetical protein